MQQHGVALWVALLASSRYPVQGAWCSRDSVPVQSILTRIKQLLKTNEFNVMMLAAKSQNI